MKETPLAAAHKNLGARMGPFGGWLMPIQYEGIIAEHNWTRSSCSIFDICHMGEFYIYGQPEKTNLNRIITCNFDKTNDGTCHYGFMLNNEGGIIDDVIIYRISSEEWMLVVNAATIDKDFEHIIKNLTSSSLSVNMSDKLAKIDVQGPLSGDVMAKIAGKGISALKYYTFGNFKLLGGDAIISRTGYTGELGFEVYLPIGKAKELWELLLKDNRVKPAGLGARDTLRLEMGYPLYGQDIDDTVTPAEAGLERFVDFTKDFIGKTAMLEKSSNALPKKLVAFVSETRRSPRHNHKIFSEDHEIGHVTSGSFLPSLSAGAGMGYIKPAYNNLGAPLVIKGENSEIEVKITSKPFYKKGSAKI